MRLQPREPYLLGPQPKEPKSIGLQPRKFQPSNVALFESLGIDFFEALFT